MRRIARALLAAVATAIAAPAAAEGQLVERVVAVIRSPAAPQLHVLTLTRLEEETRVALISRGGALAASAPLDAAALRAGLDWLVDQTLLADEAARLQILEIDATDVAGELQRFKSRFESPAKYQAFLALVDATEDELATILARTLRVKRYVESRVGRENVPDAEVAAYAASHAAELPRDPQAARGAARARIEEERVSGEVKALVSDLRRRAELRLFDLGSGR